MQSTGAYSAERASALSGVPKSTIHYWARTGVLEPGVSSAKVKLWSYSDLMSLRTIYWLRARKTDTAGAEISRTSMTAVRRALKHLRAFDIPLWHPTDEALWVTPDGEIHVRGTSGERQTLSGQLVLSDALNLTAPFPSREGLRGPDLARPREQLRILPGRISGSPHIVDTRLETQTLYSLVKDGLAAAAIRKLYPYLTATQLSQAIDLESQLERNLAIHVAA